jgi:hypothetical protein
LRHWGQACDAKSQAELNPAAELKLLFGDWSLIGVLPMMDAVKATAGEFPAYARERLQTKVRQTLGRPVERREPDRSAAWGWRWILRLTLATAVVLLIAFPILRARGRAVVQGQLPEGSQDMADEGGSMAIR